MFRISEAVPLFVTVIVSGPLVVLTFWFPKAPGLGVIVSAACVPVPVILARALTVPKIFRFAERAPAAAGVNVKRIVQEALAAMVPASAHVPPLRAKSAGFVPVMVKNGVERVSAPVPVFETVTVTGALVPPTT